MKGLTNKYNALLKHVKRKRKKALVKISTIVGKKLTVNDLNRIEDIISKITPSTGLYTTPCLKCGERFSFDIKKGISMDDCVIACASCGSLRNVGIKGQQQLYPELVKDVGDG